MEGTISVMPVSVSEILSGVLFSSLSVGRRLIVLIWPTVAWFERKITSVLRISFGCPATSAKSHGTWPFCVICFPLSHSLIPSHSQLLWYPMLCNCTPIFRYWLKQTALLWLVIVINIASIPCYMKTSFRCFKMCWNTYFLNYLCKTWSHSRQLFDSGIALLSQSLTLRNVSSFILSKVQIALMWFKRHGAAFYAEIAHECTQSNLNEVCHARYAVSHCRPPDAGGLKGEL